MRVFNHSSYSFIFMRARILIFYVLIRFFYILYQLGIKLFNDVFGIYVIIVKSYHLVQIVYHIAFYVPFL
jgi:hypothetical protein